MRNRSKALNPARILALGFIGIILIGSLLLSLPQARGDAEIGFIDILFTSTSAVCVTGLVVVDTGTFYSPLGQGIIMILIFIGSLGFMTMTTLIFMFLGHQISLKSRLIIKETFNLESMAVIVPLVTLVVRIALFFIIVGTAILSIRFIPELGLGRGLFFALFHAVSAFGNAGFDLFGDYTSLTLFPTDYLVNGTIMILFIIGGLGFTVILELINRFRSNERFSLHCQLVLVMSALLLISGAFIILSLEYNNPNTIGNMSLGSKVFSALFTSATARTAGFSVIETSLLSYSSLLVIMALMFIGASPASTGGGVKTTTFAVLLITMFSLVRGRDEQVVFLRRLPTNKIIKATTIINAAAIFIFIATVMMTLFEKHDFMTMLFEVFSAFGTVGLSTGITPELSLHSKLVLMIVMFCGRIGPVTMLIALTRKKTADNGLKFPEEDLIIG